MANADKLTVGIIALLAPRERQLISPPPTVRINASTGRIQDGSCFDGIFKFLSNFTNLISTTSRYPR
jgi:hypothetical protein